MKIYIIGTGMEGACTFTQEALEAISRSELLIGAERMIAPYANFGKELFISYKPEEIAYRLEGYSGTAAVLMSGDSGFFSGTKKLLMLLKGKDVQVICGISSMSYMCARLGLSYEDMKPITLHGRDSSIAVNVMLNRKCFFLLGGSISASEICGRLCRYGLSGVSVHVGEHLGSSEERLWSGTAAEFIDRQTDKLSVLITENPDFLPYIPSAISDDDFIRSSIPMTKAEVRCTAVAGLKIERGSVCWDIGCGTGSVSVEMAFRCPEGRVLAFDKNPEAAELTRQNSRRFGCDNIIIHEGICPEALDDAPAPDKVFIGGSTGGMKEIFGCISRKQQSADILATAVSLETLNSAVQAFEDFGGSYVVTQIAVTRTCRIGRHTMLQAQNPVFIVKGRLE